MTDASAGLDLPALGGFLAGAGLIGDASADLRPTLLPGGRSNVSYRLTAPDGSGWVLRRPPLGHTLPSAHDMGREFRVLRGLSAVGFPVPRPIVECTDASVIGAPFYLMEFVDGTVVDSAAVAARLSADEADAACSSLVETLAVLHGVEPAAAGLADLGRVGGYLQRQAARWAKQWELTRTQDVPALDALRDGVARSVAQLPDGCESTTIVHGDYRFDNVILAPGRPVVRAVLDWEMSTLGDPVVDLAILLVYWTQAADVRRAQVPVAPHITDGPGFWDRGRIVDHYADVSGRPLEHLDTCTALACFKLAVIMESIRYRALAGQQLGAGADEAAAMGAATVALAETGLAVLADGTIAGLGG